MGRNKSLNARFTECFTAEEDDSTSFVLLSCVALPVLVSTSLDSLTGRHETFALQSSHVTVYSL
jgi:hypothetical protein